jgi:O-antigen/teichoic acid export membrane protein
MTIHDIGQAKLLPGWQLFPALRERLAGLRAGEHLVTQRMAGAAFLIRVASAAIMFVSQILMARWMGGSAFGSYVYVFTWLLLLGDLVHLGIPLTAQRYVPEYTQTGSFALLRGYLSGARWLTFAAGTVAAVIGALVVWAFQASLETSLMLPFYFACVALPFYALTFMLDGLARSYNWTGVALLPQYILRPLLIIAGAGALRAAGVELDATVVMGVLAASSVASAMIQLIQVQRGLRRVVPAGTKTYNVRTWLGTSLPIILVWGMYTLLTSTDILVLKQFRPAEEVAYYYAAAKTLALMSIIHFAVSAAAAHRFTAFHVAGDRRGLVAFAANTVNWVFWPSLVVCLLVLVVGRPLLSLFGSSFTEGYSVLAILTVGQLARAAIGPAERLLNMLGQQRICALAYAAAFMVNIIGCFVLAPSYGGAGAACATAAAFVTESLLLFVIAKRRLGLHMLIRAPRA